MNHLTYFLPIGLIVISNIFYNICTKSMPENVDPFFSLTIAYLVSAILAFILFLFTGMEKNSIVESMRNVNWTSYVLGICLVGLEFGYVIAYRFGWNISLGSLVANICLGIALVAIGILFYKETLSLNHIIGIGLCLGGLFFINR